jgi:hypothetical protein
VKRIFQSSKAARVTLLAAALAILLLLAAAGCRQWRDEGVTVTTINDSGERITNLEVDYAGGSYGVATLEPGQRHTRWVRFLDDSQLTFTYRDAQGTAHTFKEGAFHKGSKGTAEVRIGAKGEVRYEQTFGK